MINSIFEIKSPLISIFFILLALSFEKHTTSDPQLLVLQVLREGSIRIEALVCVTGQKRFALRNAHYETGQDVKKIITAFEALEQFKIFADRE
jgi:hypothetical protein